MKRHLILEEIYNDILKEANLKKSFPNDTYNLDNKAKAVAGAYNSANFLSSKLSIMKDIFDNPNHYYNTFEYEDHLQLVSTMQEHIKKILATLTDLRKRYEIFE